MSVKENVDDALGVKKKMTTSSEKVREFRHMIVSERMLEDYLEKHLEVIGEEIGKDLRLIGRQYSTPVGSIDLLARDAGAGDWLVIELKKGRAADKVFGQCSRYMGWVRSNLGDGDEAVHGAIVAREIDDKLKAARDAHDTEVRLGVSSV